MLEPKKTMPTEEQDERVDVDEEEGEREKKEQRRRKKEEENVKKKKKKNEITDKVMEVISPNQWILFLHGTCTLFYVNFTILEEIVEEKKECMFLFDERIRGEETDRRR